MAVPDLRGELTVGGAQVDITGDLYARDGITHARGRPYRSNAADPASCAVTIRNVDGRYTPRNPLGPYYGQLGRNTPYQISLSGAEPYLSTTGETSTTVGASTPDASALDITGDIDIRFYATLTNWLQSGSVELAGKGLQNTNQRSWLLMMRDSKVRLEWSTAGTSTIGAASTVALPAWSGRRMAVRVTLDVNNGASGNTVTFYTADTLAGPWTQLGSTVVQSGTTSIFNSTAPLCVGNGWTDLGFSSPAGRVHALEVRNGIGGTVVANPDFSQQTVGATGFTDTAGRAWTILAKSAITDRVTRMSGEVPEWPPKWSTSEADAWTPIEAAGILRRLGQGQKALQSALRRRIPAHNPVAYWPMEDGTDATQASSPIDGVRPLTFTHVTWAGNDTLPSSDPLPVLARGTGPAPMMKGQVPAISGTLTSWLAQWVYRMDTAPGAGYTFIQISSSGTVRDWRLQLGAGLIRVIGKDSDDVSIVDSSFIAGDNLWGQWVHVQLIIEQDGSNIDWTYNLITVDGVGGAVSGTVAGTIGKPTGLTGPVEGYTADLDGLSIGHISFWSSWDANSGGAYDSALQAWAGETAGARMVRLADEEGVPLIVAGDPADTAAVGAQRSKTLLELLRECADADGGILGEARDQRALLYRPRTSLHNQAPRLTLDYAGGQLAPPFEPVEDDQVRNDWTVTREGGSSGRAVLEEGALSVLAPPDGIGLYDDSTTLNLASDDQTEPTAYWMLHLSSWDEARYPQVTVRLHRSPELIPDVLALDVGDKIRITGLPVRFASGSAVELLVDGWTEVFGPRSWEITFNCSAAGPWDVAVADSTVYGIADSDASALSASATSSAASLSVAVSDGLLWAFETAFTILVGGEEMTVTAISGASSPQTFTVTRAVNGVTKAHAAGEPVHVAHPARPAL